MNRKLLSLVSMMAIVMVSATATAADPEPYLNSALMPFYPPLARMARISGKVTLHFVVDSHGDTSEVEAKVETDAPSGNLLREAAIENVQGWKFRWPHPCDCRSKEEAVFIYKFSNKIESPERPDVTVRWFGKTNVIRVEIEGDAVEHSG